jgi:hypothetical protein
VPVIPTNQTVQNVAILAEDGACYEATQILTIAGNNTYFTVAEFGEARLVAGQKITMLPGTHVQMGGTMHAYISTNGQYCSSSAPTVSKSSDVEETSSPADNAMLSMKIYPNPATADVMVDLHGVADGSSSKMEMISVRGEVIHTSALSGNGQYPVSLHGLPSGVYIFRIVSGDQVITRMLLKK